MTYICKTFSKFPKDLYDHLYELNVRFADDRREVLKFLVRDVKPKKPEEYDFITVIENNETFTVYGIVPGWFGDPRKMSDLEIYKKSICHIVDGKIMKNRWGYADLSN